MHAMCHVIKIYAVTNSDVIMMLEACSEIDSITYQVAQTMCSIMKTVLDVNISFVYCQILEDLFFLDEDVDSYVS